MNNNSNWASVNLERQRKILEDKQRQRRINSSVSLSVEQSSSALGSSRKSDEKNKWNSSNIEKSISGLENNNIKKKENLQNSFYALSNIHGSSATELNNQTENFNKRKSLPKIITVKSLTSQKQGTSDNFDKNFSMNKITKNLPINSSTNQENAINYQKLKNVNVDCLQNKLTSNNTESTKDDNYQVELSRINASINNLNDKINIETTNLLNIKSNRQEPLKIYEDRIRQITEMNNINNNNDEIKTHIINPVLDDDEIPTEVVAEEDPICVADIINNLDNFVMQPTKKNFTLKCRITRDKKGVDKGMFPIYYLHAEKVSEKKLFLLAARRRKKSTTANYLISTDPTDLTRNGNSFIAKIRSNAIGTTFTIYDKGDNPKKASVIGDEIRKELAAIIYEPNLLGLKGPRKMVVIIPGITVDERFNCLQPVVVRPISEKDCILERYRTHRLDEMVILYNKQPIWSEETQSYVLNFHGRVTMASVKNFQIVYELKPERQESQPNFIDDKREYIVMQFGRIDNDNFTMDVRYPLSPVQAFGIAMTSFHKKLACD